MFLADIDVIAFGQPRPMHRHWIRHCRNVRAAFRLLTDQPEAWALLLDRTGGASNIALHQVSIEGFFAKAAEALGLGGLADLVAAHGPHMGNRMDGWTATNFKPLLTAMFPGHADHQFFGWMDWDVFLTDRLLELLRQWAPECEDISLFTPRGIRWEQFKLFRSEARPELVAEFRDNLQSGRYSRETPFDVQFVYDVRRVAGKFFCPVPQSEIAVHWQYLEVIGEESDPNKLDVTVTPDLAEIREMSTGRSLLMFVADREFKTLSKEQVSARFSEDARSLDFPYANPAHALAPAAHGANPNGHGRSPSIKHHCIVTPDFIGPIKNGGIGTACYHLAHFLRAELGHRVTVLFTGPVDVGIPDEWRARYAEHPGIAFHTLDCIPEEAEIPLHNVFWFHERSGRIHGWLRKQCFDAIHFQDWQANGFVPVQAKRQGLAYSQTLLTCCVHSPQQWIDEGSQMFPSGGAAALLQRYAEKYAACHADITISPSRHMLEWAEGHGWQPRNARVIPYLWTFARPEQEAGGRLPVEELCFFGRLESRKGLELFTEALRIVLALRPGIQPPRITFLGKPGRVSGRDSLAYIESFAGQTGLPVKVISDFDSRAAIEYLRAHPGRVAVMPSLLDNLPYAVIECLQSGVRLLASRAGGIPELVASREHLFAPNPIGLSKTLGLILDEGIAPARSSYDAAEAGRQWAAVAQETPPTIRHRAIGARDVTVCIAHYNHGRHLPELLASLESQTASDFKAVIVDDGSTDAQSLAVFEQAQKRRATDSNWKLLRKENGGIGEARNFAVQHAETPYVIFLDADNIAAPRMVEVMVEAMARSSADCLTCWMEGFVTAPDGSREAVYKYFPAGGCVEAGALVNIFGDANCIVSVGAFREIGGFSTNRQASFEDWELFARLCLAGKKLDVIPEVLQYYRHAESSFSRTTSAYLNYRRVIGAYTAHAPGWVAPLLECFCTPSIGDESQTDAEANLRERDEMLRQIAAYRGSWSWWITAPLRLCGRMIRALPSGEPDFSGIQDLAPQLRDLETSTSWRITAPLRKLRGMFRGFSGAAREPRHPDAR